MWFLLIQFRSTNTHSCLVYKYIHGRNAILRGFILICNLGKQMRCLLMLGAHPTHEHMYRLADNEYIKI